MNRRGRVPKAATAASAAPARESKDVLSFYAKDRVVAAVRAIAEERETSVSAVINDLLDDGIRLYRAERSAKASTAALEQRLPLCIANPTPDHPVFGGKEPELILTERRRGS